MKDKFKSRAKKQFWDSSIELAESLLQQFPNCSNTKDLVLYGKNVIVGNEEEEVNGIKDWFNAMSEPLKKNKYTKAVERIIGSVPVVYHACVYKDYESMAASSSSNSLKRLNISEKMMDSSFTDENKNIFWRYIDDINKNAADFLGKEFPKVPTREEISENIKKQKTGDANVQQHSMAKGFTTSLSALCESRQCKTAYDLSNEQEVQKVFSKWSIVCQTTVDHLTISGHCKLKSEVAISELKTKIPEMNWEDPMTDSHWNILVKLFSFCEVGGAIPGNMMNKIESMANKLANDIMSGKQDMGNMDLQSIGEEVLSQCNTSDMNDFAKNIDKILPAINNLQK